MDAHRGRHIVNNHLQARRESWTIRSGGPVCVRERQVAMIDIHVRSVRQRDQVVLIDHSKRLTYAAPTFEQNLFHAKGN